MWAKLKDMQRSMKKNLGITIVSGISTVFFAILAGTISGGLAIGIFALLTMTAGVVTIIYGTKSIIGFYSKDERKPLIVHVPIRPESSIRHIEDNEDFDTKDQHTDQDLATKNQHINPDEDEIILRHENF